MRRRSAGRASCPALSFSHISGASLPSERGNVAVVPASESRCPRPAMVAFVSCSRK
ncbi:hypothetical protein [Musicola keenii]|uniref:hypothetical protein n=1 Tax=Musicola keenii TaxID=2884250 RepID=UPI00177A76EB|nr:hypothetical protein [Musicola keenii]